MDISQRIFWYLSRSGLTWKNLEDTLEICPSTIWRWQKGETRPRRTTIRAIEKYLGLAEGCLERRSKSEEMEISVAADGIMLIGQARRLFEELMTGASREPQDQSSRARPRRDELVDQMWDKSGDLRLDALERFIADVPREFRFDLLSDLSDFVRDLVNEKMHGESRELSKSEKQDIARAVIDEIAASDPWVTHEEPKAVYSPASLEELRVRYRSQAEDRGIEVPVPRLLTAGDGSA